MSAANETAVDAFLQGKLSFDRIVPLVQHTVTRTVNLQQPTLADIYQADLQARELAREILTAL